MFGETSRLFRCLMRLAEEVGFEPTEGFDTLDRFQDDSVMTTPAPLRAPDARPCEIYLFIIRGPEYSVNILSGDAHHKVFLVE